MCVIRATSRRGARAPPAEARLQILEGLRRGASRHPRCGALPLGTGELVPRAAHDDDPLGTSRFSFELYDVTWVERLEISAGAFVGDDEGLAGAHQVGADLGCFLDPNVPGGVVHGHDDHSILSEGVCEALRHRLVLLDEGGVREPIVMWSDQICQESLHSKYPASCEESLSPRSLPPDPTPPSVRRAPTVRR